MRICYLANTAIPSTNASAIQIVKTCEAFSKLNQKVLLITTNANKAKIFDFYGVKTKFEFKKLKNFNKFPLGIKYYLFSLFSIIASLNFKPDIYITRNFFTCFLLTLIKKKTILELHHGLDIESRSVRFIVKFTNFLNSKYLVKLLAISKGAKIEYSSKHFVKKEKIIVLPSGSSISVNFENPFRREKKKIGYFGSLYDSRGLSLLTNLARIDKQNSYFLYGNTKNINKIISKKKIENLFLHNYVPYKIIPETLKKMDAFIMPYVSAITVAGDVGDVTKFTSPLKLFDYLSVGKPIICSNIKILREILENKKNAIFVNNYKNINAWKMEINKLFYQKTKVIIISKNNFKLSKEFSHSKRVKKLLDEINK